MLAETGKEPLDGRFRAAPLRRFVFSEEMNRAHTR